MRSNFFHLGIACFVISSGPFGCADDGDGSDRDAAAVDVGTQQDGSTGGDPDAGVGAGDAAVADSGSGGPNGAAVTASFTATIGAETLTITNCTMTRDGTHYARVLANEKVDLGCADNGNVIKIRYLARPGRWTDKATAQSEVEMYVELQTFMPFRNFNAARHPVTALEFVVSRWDPAAVASGGSVDITIESGANTARITGTWDGTFTDCRSEEPNPFCGL